jgi:hypothetical protein
MTYNEKLLASVDISDSEDMLLQTMAFTQTKTKNPREDLEAGDAVYIRDRYFLICKILSDQALIKELAWTESCGWQATTNKRIVYLVELDKAVELPESFVKAGASCFYRSLGSYTHTPTPVDKPRKENRWW